MNFLLKADNREIAEYLSATDAHDILDNFTSLLKGYLLVFYWLLVYLFNYFIYLLFTYLFPLAYTRSNSSTNF